MNTIIINDKIFNQLNINTNYYVSQDGDVYSIFAQKNLKWSIDSDGYPRVDIYVNNKQKHFKVHKLVWLAWNGDIPKDKQINHKDNNKLNPQLNNLYLGNQQENIRDCINNGHRVGHIWSLCVLDKENNQIKTFCPANTFVSYSGHTCASGSIKKIISKNWFKKRYKIIYYKQIENVTTMGDECSPVEQN